MEKVKTKDHVNEGKSPRLDAVFFCAEELSDCRQGWMLRQKAVESMLNVGDFESVSTLILQLSDREGAELDHDQICNEFVTKLVEDGLYDRARAIAHEIKNNIMRADAYICIGRITGDPLDFSAAEESIDMNMSLDGGVISNRVSAFHEEIAGIVGEAAAAQIESILTPDCNVLMAEAYERLGAASGDQKYFVIADVIRQQFGKSADTSKPCRGCHDVEILCKRGMVEDARAQIRESHPSHWIEAAITIAEITGAEQDVALLVDTYREVMEWEITLYNDQKRDSQFTSDREIWNGFFRDTMKVLRYLVTRGCFFHARQVFVISERFPKFMSVISAAGGALESCMKPSEEIIFHGEIRQCLERDDLENARKIAQKLPWDCRLEALLEIASHTRNCVDFGCVRRLIIEKDRSENPHPKCAVAAAKLAVISRDPKDMVAARILRGDRNYLAFAKITGELVDFEYALTTIRPQKSTSPYIYENNMYEIAKAMIFAGHRNEAERLINELTDPWLRGNLLLKFYEVEEAFSFLPKKTA